MTSPIAIKKVKRRDTFSLGSFSLSENQIIEYAKEFDPLPFHTNKEAGAASMFGGLIASGPQIFHLVHKNQWLPRFGNSVLCGQAVNNWKFHQPLYPNQTVNSQITIKEITNGRKKNTASITWFYEFLDENSKPIQTLEMIILHNME